MLRARRGDHAKSLRHGRTGHEIRVFQHPPTPKSVAESSHLLNRGADPWLRIHRVAAGLVEQCPNKTVGFVRSSSIDVKTNIRELTLVGLGHTVLQRERGDVDEAIERARGPATISSNELGWPAQRGGAEAER